MERPPFWVNFTTLKSTAFPSHSELYSARGEESFGNYVWNVRVPYVNLAIKTILKNPANAAALLITTTSHEVTHMAQDALARLHQSDRAVEYEKQQIEWEANDISFHVLKYMRPNSILTYKLGDKTFSIPARSVLKDLIDRPRSLASLVRNLNAATGQVEKLLGRMAR